MRTSKGCLFSACFIKGEAIITHLLETQKQAVECEMEKGVGEFKYAVIRGGWCGKQKEG